MTEKGRDICSINGITLSVIDGITVSAIDGITVREIMSGITKYQNQECIKIRMNNALNSELDIKISNKFQFRILHIL